MYLTLPEKQTSLKAAVDDSCPSLIGADRLY